MPLNPPEEGPLLTSANDAMLRVLALAAGVAPTPATVLLTGESGTGKEVLARYVHDASPRARRPFVAINCGALPPTLVESELFGHERGAFSGAGERRIGRIEAADRGTLLLDEISEMPLELQVKLLRVIQERQVHRVGGSAPVDVDVRVIATSNRDLRQRVASGGFREDLFYRINVFPIHVPPLRERRADIPLLAAALLKRTAARFNRPTPRLSPQALERLVGFPFPGNVRQLANVLERALILSQGDEVRPEHLMLDAEAGWPTVVDTPRNADALRDVEQETILQVLSECGGNRTHAARRLGISLRTLRNRLRDYRAAGIPIPEPGTARVVQLQARR